MARQCMELARYETRIGDITIAGYLRLMRSGRLPGQNAPAPRRDVYDTRFTLEWAANMSGTDTIRPVIEDIANGLHQPLVLGPRIVERYLLIPALGRGRYLLIDPPAFEEIERRIEQPLDERALEALTNEHLR